ncbi:MAG TPA: gamma-glutamyltransferase [Gemmataceae bacterium]
MKLRLTLAALLFSAATAAWLYRVESQPAPDRSGDVAVGTRGMVVCVSPPAAEAGLAVLKKGGTAVDAAVAVGFALAVTYPPAGNIGGGGFMIVHPGAGKEPAFFDYREMAPAAATPDMFAKGTDRFSPKAVGVPGTVRGLELAHRRFGKLPWKDLVLPAVRLAEEGFPLERPMAESLNRVLDSSRTPAEFRRVYGPPEGKKRWEPGDRLVQPELARTLRRIAEEGPDAFYTGELAELLESEMKRSGGLITREDLKAYRARERKPTHGTFRGYDVYAAAPPSSGGVALVQMLNILETFDLKRAGRWSAEANHLIIEAMRRAYRDRARYLGDPDFVEVPAFLTSKEYARKLAEGIDPNKATPSAALAGDIPLAPEGEHTTHFSVIDKNGLAVSNTYTLEASYGTRIVVKGAGYLLNNEMTDFNHRPGYTDRLGAIGTEPNRVAPHKRMLSSMCPTIVARDGKPVLITGSPGGRTIINTVLCVVLNVTEFGMDVRAAVDAPRLHHQWFPDLVRFEGVREHPLLVQKLRAMGHTVLGTRQGDAHTIRIDPETGKYLGAADRRIHGAARGY